MLDKYIFECSIFSLVAGLGLIYIFPVLRVIPALIFFIVSLIFFLGLYFSSKKFYLLLALFFLGLWRYELLWPVDIKGRIENYYNQNFKIIGQIIAEPELKDDKQKIKLKIFYGQDTKGTFFKLKGKILVVVNKYPVYNYNDLVEIEGEYLKPGFIDKFDYSMYLKRYGLTAVMYYPQIKIFQSKKDLLLPDKINIKYFLYNFKNKLSKQFDYYLSGDSSAFIKAMMLNDKKSLSLNLQEEFSRSGLSHIVAISGLHISLLSSLLLGFLIIIGFRRTVAFYIVLFFLLIYLILVGFPASASRATVMAILSSLSLYLGRPSSLLRVLFLVGTLLVFINPLILWVDLGFQLSFLAVLAIIIIHPLMSIWLNSKIFSKTVISKSIVDIISLTLSVQVLTAPFLISSFNQFSLIAPISNLLIIWLIPLIMTLSILALVVSFIIPFLAQLIFLFLDWSLKYVLLINHLSANIPGAILKINYWPSYFSVLYYLILFFIIKKIKIKNGDT